MVKMFRALQLHINVKSEKKKYGTPQSLFKRKLRQLASRERNFVALQIYLNHLSFKISLFAVSLCSNNHEHLILEITCIIFHI